MSRPQTLDAFLIAPSGTVSCAVHRHAGMWASAFSVRRHYLWPNRMIFIYFNERCLCTSIVVCASNWECSSWDTGCTQKQIPFCSLIAACKLRVQEGVRRHCRGCLWSCNASTLLSRASLLLPSRSIDDLQVFLYCNDQAGCLWAQTNLTNEDSRTSAETFFMSRALVSQ